MDDLISISKCATAIGVHKSTLAGQVKSQQVRSHGGKVRLSEVLEDRAANIDLTRSGRRSGKIDDAAESVGSADADPTIVSDPTLSDDAEPTVIVDGKAMSYSEARALKESYLARLRQLEFHERSGRVVRVSEVIDQVAGEYAIVRNRVLGLPSLLAPRLVGRSAEEIRSTLHDEIRGILAHLSDPQQIADDAVIATAKGKQH